MKKILIVDDDVDYVKLLKMRLEANLLQVITAHDGSEGLQKAEAERS